MLQASRLGSTLGIMGFLPMRNFSARAGRYVEEVAGAVRADVLIYAAALIYLLAGAAYVLLAGRTVFAEYDLYVLGCVILVCVLMPYAAIVLAAIRIVFAGTRRRRLAWRTIIAPPRVGRFVAGTLLMLVLLLFFEAMYTTVKTTFSADAFPYDKLIADIDKALHFGHAPSYWLAFLRSDWLLRIVETNYDGVWFPFWLITLYWFCTSPHAEKLRVRFVLTFMMVWVLIGNVVASLALTAGPALYGKVTGDHERFAKLLQFLDSTPNSTSVTQHYLWTLHETGAGGLGSGISAFPSIHVAVAACCALFISEIDKRFGLAAWVYVAIIMLSSVYLGWHYAVDGYAAVVLTTAIYWAVRRAPELLKLRFRRGRPAAVGITARTTVSP